MIAHVGKGNLKPIRARANQERPCVICGKPIELGDRYIRGIGGTNSRRQGNAHRSCWIPGKKGGSMTTEITQKPRCPKCRGTSRTRFRIRTQDYVCDQCGHEWAKQEEAQKGKGK